MGPAAHRPPRHASAWLGAGSRDGDRLAHLRNGLSRLAATPGIRIESVSSLYETEPIDLPGEAPVLNGALRLATTLSPERLLEACLAVERAAGRVRGAPPDRSSRPLDLDILLYDDLVLAGNPSLGLPHPRMHLRRFVLVPLAEIDPGALHPALGLTVGALLAACDDRSWVHPAHPPSAWRPPR